jgi:hypothetical protein
VPDRLEEYTLLPTTPRLDCRHRSIRAWPGGQTQHPPTFTPAPSPPETLPYRRQTRD